MYHDEQYWQHLAARIDQSKGVISMKSKTRTMKEDVFVDATPTAVGVVTHFNTYHAQMPETGILNAEAAALWIGLRMAKSDSVVHTDNLPLYYMIRNKKTKNLRPPTYPHR